MLLGEMFSYRIPSFTKPFNPHSHTLSLSYKHYFDTTRALIQILIPILCDSQDCMEEINLFSENKTHLKLLGEQLITASNKTKETEVNDKLKDINDRWQHLFDHIETR